MTPQFPIIRLVVRLQVIIGSRVLAHDGDGWYRSLVRNIDGDNVEVFILDLAALITVDASTLKVASPQLFELPIMAVPARLAGTLFLMSHPNRGFWPLNG